MKAILREDVKSRIGKKRQVYGLKGEPVTIISDYGNVLIVEGKRGRFPVSQKNVDRY